MYTTAPQNWPGRPCPRAAAYIPQRQGRTACGFYAGAAYATYRQERKPSG